MIKIEEALKEKICLAVNQLGIDITVDEIVIETPKDESLGDFSTNVALKYARVLKDSPQNIAEKITNILQNDISFKSVTVAGPGFINFVLNPAVYYFYLPSIISEDNVFGTFPRNGVKLNLEYVSANPTGDLHLGHARGAAIGDSLSRILMKAGYDVTREFYVNDAGKQVENLALSLYARYLQSLGVNCSLPEDGYYGQDVIDIAKEIKNKIGDKYLDSALENKALAFFLKEGKKRELAKIKKDLKGFRVLFDVYTNETDIRKKYNLEDLISRLGDNTYISEGARFLKTSAYLDDKDRPIVKSDGSYTYLLPDIAYHLDKMSRGFDFLIDVLGADHHGYIPRITSALMMFGYPEKSLSVEIIQMVRLVREGAEVKMSKRTGNAYRLRDLVSEAGLDSVRYFFVNRSASTHLDFDLDLALEKSNANPVYYAQYAHARLAKVLKLGRKYDLDLSGDRLIESQEMGLMKQIVAFEKVILEAANERAPYKIANYIQKLANSIHYFYTKSRLINPADVELTKARLGLAKAAQIVMKNSLELIGVSAPLKM